jgi:hypothetical protein
MATCPACDHDVATPFFLNLDAWRHLVCTHCKARLELKPPRAYVLGPLMAPLIMLGRQGRVFVVTAFVFMHPFSCWCWKASVLKCDSEKRLCPHQPSG